MLRNIETLNEEHYKPSKKYKYGTIVPLVGGMTIGNKMATGNNPDFLISYPAFGNNDKHIKHYMPDVPYFTIDEETNMLMEPTEENPDINRNISASTFEGVDFVSAVCPCAGLSSLNASSKKGSKWTRGSGAQQNDWMYKSTTFVLENIKPKVLFGENAPGLYTGVGAGVVENLKRIGDEYGYTLSLYKTNTQYHGIPQKRERTFYFFWKDDKVPLFNQYRRDKPTLVEYLREIPNDATMQDMIPGIKSFEDEPYIQFIKYKEGKNWRKAVGDGIKTASIYVTKNNLIDEMIKWVDRNVEGTEDNPKLKERTIKSLEHIKYKQSIGKGWWDSTPHFFKNDINAIIGRTMLTAVHPEEDRGYNIRELAHLMGLPHDFEIGKLKEYNHLAQNVPTCTARDVTYEVLKYLDGKLPMINTDFIKQTNSAQRIDTPIDKNVKELF